MNVWSNSCCGIWRTGPIISVSFFHPCKRFEKFLILGCVCAGAHVTTYMWGVRAQLVQLVLCFFHYIDSRDQKAVWEGWPAGPLPNKPTLQPRYSFILFTSTWKNNLGGTVGLMHEASQAATRQQAQSRTHRKKEKNPWGKNVDDGKQVKL